MSPYHLGINMGHDRSVAVVKDGEVVVAIEQERLDRIKHSVGFMLQAPDAMGQIQVPGESIAYCLDHLGLPLGEMATITANMPGVDNGAGDLAWQVLQRRGGSRQGHTQPPPGSRILGLLAIGLR